MKNNILKFSLFCVLSSQVAFAELITPYQAYNLALEHSNKLKSKHYQVLAKKEALNQQYARLYPTVSASVNYNNTHFERNELSSSYAYEPKVEETSLDYAINLRQTLYDHEIYTKIDTEKKRVELFDIDYKINKHELAAEVLTVYLELFKSKNKIHLISSSIDYSEKNLMLMDKKFKMNLANKMDFLEAKVEFERNKIELVREKKNFDLNMLKLKQLISKDDIDLPILNLDTFSKKLFNTLHDFNFEETLLENNLEILQAKKTVEMGDLEQKNAFSAHYPKLTFDARYTKYNSDDPTPDYENYSKVAVNLEIPIYSGGSISSRVAEMKLTQRSSKEDLIAIKKELEVKFGELKSQLKSSLESMEVYNNALLSARTFEESVNLGYEKGLKSIIDVHEARNKVFKIEEKYIENIQNFIDSYVGFLVLTNDLDSLSLIDNII